MIYSEAILCNINSDLELVSKLDLVYPETLYFPGMPPPFNNTPNASIHTPHDFLHPRLKRDFPYLPGPTVPVYPPPFAWQGKQRTHTEVSYESVRAGMWHNGSPGEIRILLDYSGIVSAYDETYTSLAKSRRGTSRSKHRLGDISPGDWERLKGEVHGVLTRERSPTRVNWRSLFQTVLDRYAERLEELRHVLLQADLNPVEVVAVARQKVLIMLTPYMVLPRAKSVKQSPHQIILGHSNPQSEPDNDWFERVYGACASYATAGILRRADLTVQEQRLANSLDHVQGVICSSLTNIWASAFDSADKPVFARRMIVEWAAEVAELMEWLDWHVWVRCNPPCAPGVRVSIRGNDFLSLILYIAAMCPCDMAVGGSNRR
jgi:hypothetical protein